MDYRETAMVLGLHSRQFKHRFEGNVKKKCLMLSDKTWPSTHPFLLYESLAGSHTNEEISSHGQPLYPIINHFYPSSTYSYQEEFLRNLAQL